MVAWLSAVAMTVVAQATTLPPDTRPPADPPASASNLWFSVGEEIIYNIYWGVVHVGSSHVKTGWVQHEDGRTLLQVRFESRSNKVLAMLYPVEDMQEVLIEPETFLPVEFRKVSRQGRRRYNDIIRFDHATGQAHLESFLTGKKKTIAIEPDTREIISLMYLVRSMNVDVGAEKTMKVLASEKIYDLFIKVPRKEPVKLERYGAVESYLFDPEAAFDGLFVRKGKVYLWVSADERRLCTKISAAVPVASIEIRLAEVKGPGDDFWVQPIASSASPRERMKSIHRGR